MTGKYVLDGHEPRAVEDVIEWAMWFEKTDRRVARDSIGDVGVSTVFLGFDHAWGAGPPELFETMVFGGEHDEDTWRYATWPEAEAGHRRVVEALRDGREP